MSKTIRAKAKFCSAILGVGLLGLTGCSGSAVADVKSAPSATAATSSAAPSATAAPAPKPTPEPTPSAEPTPEVVVTEEWIESEIPFESIREDDPNTELGKEARLVAGVAGVKATRFEVTITDGVETGRVAAGDEIRVAPVNEVIAVGSKPVEVAPPQPPVQAAPPPPPVQAAAPAGNCDPNYGGGCVPIDSDVDCAAGSGNGPSYVQGPVTVIGSDIYGLDRDGDGVGCE